MKKRLNIIMSLALFVLLFQGCATTKPNKPAEEMFKDGQYFFQSGRYDDAIEQWKKVKESYFSPELSAQAEIGIADSYFLNGDYIEAAAEYENFRKLHPSHERSAYALYRQGMSFYNQINRIDTDQTPVKNALTLFDSYIKQYPGTKYIAEVQLKYQECKDKQLSYELYVGSFYLKNNKPLAAIARFEEALKNFPESRNRDEVLYQLGRAYLESGQKSKGREIYGRLFREFPNSTFVPDANKVMDKYF